MAAVTIEYNNRPIEIIQRGHELCLVAPVTGHRMEFLRGIGCEAIGDPVEMNKQHSGVEPRFRPTRSRMIRTADAGSRRIATHRYAQKCTAARLTPYQSFGYWRNGHVELRPEP